MLVTALNFSCPAVSHSCAMIVLLSAARQTEQNALLSTSYRRPRRAAHVAGGSRCGRSGGDVHGDRRLCVRARVYAAYGVRPCGALLVFLCEQVYAWLCAFPLHVFTLMVCVCVVASGGSCAPPISANDFACELDANRRSQIFAELIFRVPSSGENA